MRIQFFSFCLLCFFFLTPGFKLFAEEAVEKTLDLSIDSNLKLAQTEPPVLSQKLNIEDCLKLTALNNKELRAQDFEILRARYRQKQARVRGIPVLEYDFLIAPAPRNVDDAVRSFVTGNVTFFQKGKIAFGLPLYSFGKIGLAQELALQGLLAEELKKNKMKGEQLLRTKRLYYGILLAKDLSELLEDAKGHLESEIERKKKLEEAQANSEDSEDSEAKEDPVELVKLKLYLFEVLNRIHQVEQKSALGLDALRLQLGLSPQVEVNLAEAHLEPLDYDLEPLKVYLEEAKRHQANRGLLKVGLRAKEAQWQLKKKEMTPDFGFGGFYEFGYTIQEIEGLVLTDDFNNPFNFQRAGVGIRLKGKLDVKGSTSKIKQAEAEYLKVALQQSAALEGLDLELKKTYLGVQNKKKNLVNQREAMKTARQYVFLTQTNLDIGIGDKNAYSEALQAYLLTRGRYFEAILNYNMAVGELEEKAGRLARKYGGL